MYKIRTWTSAHFGKYVGKTLPEILMTDPNYFFWCYEKGYFSKGRLAGQAADIHKQACHMRVPRLDGERHDAEYFVDPQTEQFVKLELIPRSQPQSSGDLLVVRMKFIDLSFAFRRCPKDAKGGHKLIADVKKHLLVLNRERPTTEECNALFNNIEPFITEPEPGYHWLHGRKS